jgi:hypothetical protein
VETWSGEGSTAAIEQWRGGGAEEPCTVAKKVVSGSQIAQGLVRRSGPPGNPGAASWPAGVAVWARRRDPGCEPREGSRVRCERGRLNLVPFLFF